ncbi:MAG: DUF523 domain-containing protein [Lachnospiraceae bacterium]|nr:DUF523 domain-containing protein [Lachnospiraceae bacterium]
MNSNRGASHYHCTGRPALPGIEVRRRGRGAAAGLEGRAELAVLQSRSPSCGVRQVYDGSFTGKLRDGQGVFAEMLREAGIKKVDAEEIASMAT